jgi:hypothetical protein
MYVIEQPFLQHKIPVTKTRTTKMEITPDLADELQVCVDPGGPPLPEHPVHVPEVIVIGQNLHGSHAPIHHLHRYHPTIFLSEINHIQYS